MHAYLYGRVWRLPWPAALAPHRWWLGLMVLALWLSFLPAQNVWRVPDAASYAVQLAGYVWLGTVFLLFTCTLAGDAATAFGWLASPRRARRLRLIGTAAGVVLSIAALVQGHRAPVVRDEEVTIPGLQADYDGLVIVQIADLHLGELLRAEWVDARVEEVEALHPDLIVVDGDVLNDPTHVAPLVPNLGRLHARLGVWAVTGNHEFFGGLDRSLKIFHDAGFRVLRDEWIEIAPGLVLAGVDDLTARRQVGISVDAVGRALNGRPAGTTIFLSHTPWNAEYASRLGANLMLSGHTHDGQIWPFRYLVRLFYPRIAGRFEVGNMTLLVSRGTGLWGPPMRLFYPSETLRITLRRPRTASPSRIPPA
jgi:predicted MPP superfamily phosphohydrolase